MDYEKVARLALKAIWDKCGGESGMLRAVLGTAINQVFALEGSSTQETKEVLLNDLKDFLYVLEKTSKNAIDVGIATREAQAADIASREAHDYLQ